MLLKKPHKTNPDVSMSWAEVEPAAETPSVPAESPAWSVSTEAASTDFVAESETAASKDGQSRRRTWRSPLKKPSPEEEKRARATLDDFLEAHKEYELHHPVQEMLKRREAEERKRQETVLRARERLNEARERQNSGPLMLPSGPTEEDVEIFKAKIYGILARASIDNFYVTKAQILTLVSTEEGNQQRLPHPPTVTGKDSVFHSFTKPPACAVCGSRQHRTYHCNNRDRMFLW
eukprot:m.253284 g.253284  ORF g.253284 m.253284 type:complete len:234 (+) comp40369_c0_seq35:2393-3094(+)